MFLKKIGFLFVLACVGLFLSFPSHAAQPKQIGTYGDWTAYMLTEQGSKVCYMVSKPISAKGKYTRRGDVFALITHRPGENTRDVFSYITGYQYKKQSDATVMIDSKKFTLFTQDETAWTPDAASDKRLSKAVRSGSKMIVKGVSSRGTATTDTFSLKGSGAAYKAISKSCNIKI